MFDRESCTYTYLLADEKTREAVLVDTVCDLHERDLALVEQLEIKVKYLLETHIHADHVTGAGKIKPRTRARLVLGAASRHPQADILLKDGETLAFGRHTIKALATPGHTESCTSYLCRDKLFTGDALFIRGCGRTDFQGGSPQKLYHSVHKKIYALPDSTAVYPGHDYNGHTRSSVGEEKKFNPRLNLRNSPEDFCRIMDNLNLPRPRLMDEAVPQNLNCLEPG